MTVKQILQEKGVDATLQYIYTEIEGMERKKEKMIREIAKLAIEPAESVLHIFEKEYPKDDRPRKAIEAAKRYFDDPSEKNAKAAQVAAEYTVRAAVADGGAAGWAAVAAVVAAKVAARAVDASVVAVWTVDAVIMAAVAAGTNEEEAEQEMREKQKQIILKYFGDDAQLNKE